MSSTLQATYERLFRQALRIRMVEEEIIRLYPTDCIQSPVHLSIGQEGVAVGICDSLMPDDWVFSTYRSHAFFLAKGGNMNIMFAELSGKATGNSKGKAGSMHLTSPEVGMMGSSAVVASSIPHAVGAAYASKMKGENRIHIVIFGDGATEEGVYHESLNFAALHKLPLIFVCENNGFAVHSYLETRQSYTICEHARSYGLKAHHITDGMDFVSVKRQFEPIVEAARAGNGPLFVEIDTYRYKEHVGTNDDFHFGYRSRQDLEAWQVTDPLIQDTILAETLTPNIGAEIKAAVDFAEASDWPSSKEVESDVDRPDPDAVFASTWKTSDVAPGQSVMTYSNALMATMRNALETNDDSLIVGQGVDDFKGIFGTTTDLHKEFGQGRCFDTPLMEEGLAGISLGMALNGIYSIQTHIRADFILLAANQIINLIGKYRYMFGGLFEAPLLIRAVVGRSWGQGAQHSQSLQSLFAHIPGLTVIMPANSQSILETYPYVMEHYRGPVISFEHRLLYELEFAVNKDAVQAPQMPLTSRKVRTGKDLTIVASSIMVLESQRAAKHMSEYGIDCDVIDINCASHPNHQMILESVRKTGHLLIADSSWLPYGVAAEVCRIVCQRDPSALKAPVAMLGMADAPCPTAKTLEDLYYPNLANFVDTAARLVHGRSDHGVPLPDEHSMRDVYKHFKGPF